MAVEYHLLTAFGTGKTVTMSIASPCVVTYTAHGLSDGFKVVFTTTGALPTGVTSGTTYYAKSTAANTFNLYTDAGLTNVVNTSGSQSGTHTIVSDYWYRLPTSGSSDNWKSRYYYSGAYQVFAKLSEWLSNLPSRYDYKTNLILEIAEKWTDTSSAYTDQFQKFYSVLITTKINGVWGSGFHNGAIGGGWMQRLTGNCWRGDYAVFEGLDIKTTSGACFINPNPCIVRFCIICSTGSNGIGQYGGGHVYHNNLVYGCSGIGIGWADYNPTVYIYNNTVIGCGTGLEGRNKAYVQNNVALGNTTNWGTTPASGYFSNNAGLSGEAWTSSGASRVVVASSDFKNYVVPVTSASDFRPSGDSTAHTSSSALVDVASQDFADMLAIDITGSIRPSYKNGSATNWDIGCYEFDWGYGVAPSTVNISITGMASGSEIAIYKASDMSQILAPQSTTGSYSGTYPYTADTNIIVRVRKGTAATRYLPYEYAGTITSTGFQLVVSQIPDTIAQ